MGIAHLAWAVLCPYLESQLKVPCVCSCQFVADHCLTWSVSQIQKIATFSNSSLKSQAVGGKRAHVEWRWSIE